MPAAYYDFFRKILLQPMSPAAIEQIAVQPIPEEPSNPS